MTNAGGTDKREGALVSVLFLSLVVASGRLVSVVSSGHLVSLVCSLSFGLSHLVSPLCLVSRLYTLVWSLILSGLSSSLISRLLWSFSRPFSLISILLSLAGREICLFIFLQCCVSIGVSVHLSCFCLSVCMCAIRTIPLILVQSSAHWVICLSKNPGPGLGASGTPPKALNFQQIDSNSTTNYLFFPFVR